MDDDIWYDDFPVILGQGSLHDLSDREAVQASRLWNLKSTSKAACVAADKRPEPRPRKVGFLHRRPR